MKWLSITFCLCALVLHGCSYLLIVADYRLNKAFIATTLCENKAKPEMKCQGKCYLKKKLAKEQKENKDSSGQKTGSAVIVLFHSAGNSNDYSLPVNGLRHTQWYLLTDYTSPLFSFFHPPQTCS